MATYSLKRSTGGHLLRTPSGHLANECTTVSCTISGNPAPALAFTFSWTDSDTRKFWDGTGEGVEPEWYITNGSTVIYCPTDYVCDTSGADFELWWRSGHHGGLYMFAGGYPQFTYTTTYVHLTYSPYTTTYYPFPTFTTIYTYRQYIVFVWDDASFKTTPPGANRKHFGTDVTCGIYKNSTGTSQRPTATNYFTIGAGALGTKGPLGTNQLNCSCTIANDSGGSITISWTPVGSVGFNGCGIS